MDKEIWTIWEPQNKIRLGRGYWLDKAIQDSEGFQLFLAKYPDDSLGEPYIRVEFPGCIYAYKYQEEQSALITLSNVVNESGDWLARKATFFIVQNSKFLENILYESCGTVQRDRLIHFAIVGSNEVFDVVTDHYPEVLKDEPHESQK